MLSFDLLFKIFLKLGATAYGGPAIAGQVKKTIVKDLGWMKEPEFMQGLALCQLIPGATFVISLPIQVTRFTVSSICRPVSSWPSVSP